MQTSAVAARGLSSCGSLSSASSPKEGGGRTRDLQGEQGIDDTREWQHPSERCSNNGGWLWTKGPEGSQAPAGGGGTVSSKRGSLVCSQKVLAWERERKSWGPLTPFGKVWRVRIWPQREVPPLFSHPALPTCRPALHSLQAQLSSVG